MSFDHYDPDVVVDADVVVDGGRPDYVLVWKTYDRRFRNVFVRGRRFPNVFPTLA